MYVDDLCMLICSRESLQHLHVCAHVYVNLLCICIGIPMFRALEKKKITDPVTADLKSTHTYMYSSTRVRHVVLHIHVACRDPYVYYVYKKMYMHITIVLNLHVYVLHVSKFS